MMSKDSDRLTPGLSIPLKLYEVSLNESRVCQSFIYMIRKRYGLFYLSLSVCLRLEFFYQKKSPVRAGADMFKTKFIIKANST